MFTVETRAGRLIEVFLASPFPLQEVEAMTQAVRLQVVAASEPVLLCARLDQLRVMTPEANELLLQMLRRDNPRLVRSGYLLGQRYGTLSMQVDRLVREANNPNRRWFDRPEGLLAFLGAVTRPDELARLRAFLAQDPAPPSKPGEGPGSAPGSRGRR